MESKEMTTDDERWEALERPLPEWFRKAKLGYFIHWGPYSVPAWGEPVAELGTLPPQEWYKHNPYSEWYYNTILLDGSPAQQHHEEVYGGRPYDDFLDEWETKDGSIPEVVELLADNGGSYLVLTTKHHDGVCLWDAPGTGDRNTVHRGPKEDLVETYAEACERAGIRFGVYYSGGLDWHVRPFQPIGTTDDWSFEGLRPVDEEYAEYAAGHVRDLMDRYSPDVLWNDIEWPDAGKNFSEIGIGKIFEEFYERNPEGVVNDRWQVPHQDYLTSEYQHMLDKEDAAEWENTRGVGLSFAYNAEEGSEHALSGPEAIKHLIDAATRGGRLLLGVGPKADGTLPQWQIDIVKSVGEWMRPMQGIIDNIQEGGDEVDIPADWVRFGKLNEDTIVFVDSDIPVDVPEAELLSADWATLEGGVLTLADDRPGPAVIKLS